MFPILFCFFFYVLDSRALELPTAVSGCPLHSSGLRNVPPRGCFFLLLLIAKNKKKTIRNRTGGRGYSDESNDDFVDEVDTEVKRHRRRNGKFERQNKRCRRTRGKTRERWNPVHVGIDEAPWIG